MFINTVCFTHWHSLTIIINLSTVVLTWYWTECSINWCSTDMQHTHHFLDLSLGGGFLGMRKSARIGCMSHSATGQKKKQGTFTRNIHSLIKIWRLCSHVDFNSISSPVTVFKRSSSCLTRHSKTLHDITTRTRYAYITNVLLQSQLTTLILKCYPVWFFTRH